MKSRLLLLALGLIAAPVIRAQEPNFAREVRPILSDHCFACHGPDEQERQAGLRLDTSEGLQYAIDSEDPDASLLLERLVTDDPDLVMPPPDFRKPLSPEEKQTLTQWIESGGKSGQHWAFLSPVKAEPPANDGDSAIDRFLLDELARVGLSPAPPADRRTLLRRVHLDLTGLPPSRNQMREFLADRSPDAYENLVDRLLNSPRHAEHLARYWLDLVRFADTHGLHLDNYREMWPYRDWVIKAFAENMPFDQFVTEQLAGDLLAGATDEQKIASGFNRLNVTTNEGGSIYDEVFARNVMDRTDAFGTIFLGLTTGCSSCHDHKFDPLTMRDYYSLSAFFNSLDGRAMDQNIEDPPPVLTVPDEEQQRQLEATNQALADLSRQMNGPIASVDQAQRRWEDSVAGGKAAETVILQPTAATSVAGKQLQIGDDGSIALKQQAADRDTIVLTASLPQGDWQTLRLEALVDSPEDRVGASENGNVVLSEIEIETSSSPDQGNWTPVSIRHASADYEQAGDLFSIAHAHDGNVGEEGGWAVGGHEKPGPRTAWFVLGPIGEDADEQHIRIKLKYQSKYRQHQFRSVRLALSDSAPSVPAEHQIGLGPVHVAGPFPVENPNPAYGRKFASQQSEFDSNAVFSYEEREYRWHHRADLSQVEVHSLPAISDRSTATLIHRSLIAPSSQKLGLLLDTDDGHVVFLNGKQIGQQRGAGEISPLAHEYELPLEKGPNRLYIKVVNHGGSSRISYAFRSPAIQVPKRLAQLLAVPIEQRTDDDRHAIRRYYRQVVTTHPDWLVLVDQQKGLRQAKRSLVDSFPTTLVWKETEEPRPAYMLERGQYDQPGEPVPRETPGFLPQMPPGAPKNRLGLAAWLVSDSHPLTARVAVNRFWQQIFGTGLVKTSEDFGSQGEPPSHPELLDWLAVDFLESGWDVRRLIKTMVMSEAYRRSSVATPKMLKIDPQNRLLARSPRYRLDAEVLRDQALSLSKLLVHRIGGPSVKPPQPSGLWQAVGYTRSNTATFKADTDDRVYRRSVYIFWKRTSAPPQMSTFDAPSRESCTARRERTNTPLQALLMLNEQQYIEASKHLAMRVLEQHQLDGDPRRQCAWLFETITIRPPTESELNELVDLWRDLANHYGSRPDEAAKLVGDKNPDLAPWAMVASTLLNLDEVVSK